MNDLERQVRDTLLRHQDDAPPFDISDARRTARRTRRRQARNVVVGAIGVAALIMAFAGLGGLVRADRSPTVLDTPSPSLPPPGPADAHVSGWPGRSSRNPAGVYSWDGIPFPEFPNQTLGLMHNGHGQGPGDVNIVYAGRCLGGSSLIGDKPAVTVAGFEGTYRQFIGKNSPASWMDGLPSEEWMVDIQGTTVTILLVEEPGARETELADAHADHRFDARGAAGQRARFPVGLHAHDERPGTPDSRAIAPTVGNA